MKRQGTMKRKSLIKKHGHLKKRGLMRRNLLRAIGILVCGAVAIWAVGSFLDAHRGGTAPFSARPAKVTLQSVFADEEGRNESARLPAGFEEELFPLTGFYDVRVSQAGGVIGLLSHEPVHEVMEALDRELASRGWAKAPSGQEGCASYVKAEGVYTWLLIACTEVDGDVSVLVAPA